LSVSVEQLLYQGLIGNSGFTSLLGVDAGGNFAFYDKQLPQQNFNVAAAVYPAGVYQRISSPRVFALQSTTQGNVGRARFQLTFWSNAKNGTVVLDQIDRAVKNFFQTFDAFNPEGSPPTFIQAGFISYDSRTEIEPQTQPTLQKLVINVIFWFSDQS